jgi:hypothetical protein
MAWSGSVAAVVVVVAAALIAGNASGRPALAVAVGVVQAAFLAGWLVSFTATVDAAVLAVAAVAIADVVVLRTRTATGGSIAGVIGLAVIGVLFHQLARRDPRGVTAAVALTLSAIVLGAAPALLLPLRELPPGRSAGFVALIAAGAALLAVRLPVGPDPVRRVFAALVGLGVALACGAAKGGLSTGHAVALGACCVVTALLADRLVVRIAADPVPPAPDQPRRASALLSEVFVAAIVPLFLMCPVAYLVGRVIAPSAG